MEKWINQEKYEEGMAWEFFTAFASDGKEQGTIIESAPKRGNIEMAYSYDSKTQTLTVDIEIEDKYQVIPSIHGTDENPIIRLSILTGEFPAPYMQYVLRKM